MVSELASVAIDEAASGPDYREGTTVSSSAKQISVNLAGVCAKTCGTDNANVLFNVATAPVPEPATWAMMIGGIGLVGYASRRRSAAIRIARTS